MVIVPANLTPAKHIPIGYPPGSLASRLDQVAVGGILKLHKLKIVNAPGGAGVALAFGPLAAPLHMGLPIPPPPPVHKHLDVAITGLRGIPARPHLQNPHAPPPFPGFPHASP